MASTYMEVVIRNLANLMIHNHNINQLIHEYRAKTSLEERKSFKKVFNIHEVQLKTMRFELNRNAQYIKEIHALYPDMDSHFFHIMTKDSQKSFKILQKIETIGAPLRQTLNLDIAFQERRNAYHRYYARALAVLCKKYDEKFDCFYRKWENKSRKLCTMMDEMVEQCRERITKLNESTFNLLQDVNALNLNQIKKLTQRYGSIIAEAMLRTKANIEFTLYKVKMLIYHHISSDGLCKKKKKKKLHRIKLKHRLPKSKLKLTSRDSNVLRKEEKPKKSSIHQRIIRVISNWKTRKKK